MVKAALRRPTRFETARLAAAIFRTALIAAAVIVTTRLVSARVTALGRSVFGRRQVATACGRALLRATSAMASTTTAPASATATVAAAVTTTIAATSEILACTIATPIGARGVILRGIVLRRKILGSRGVRIRLTLFGVMSIVVHFGSVGAESFVGTGLVFYNTGLLVVREGIAVRRFQVRSLVLK